MLASRIIGIMEEKIETLYYIGFRVWSLEFVVQSIGFWGLCFGLRVAEEISAYRSAQISAQCPKASSALCTFRRKDYYTIEETLNPKPCTRAPTPGYAPMSH